MKTRGTSKMYAIMGWDGIESGWMEARREERKGWLS
jgi:hypothetical protein